MRVVRVFTKRYKSGDAGGLAFVLAIYTMIGYFSGKIAGRWDGFEYIMGFNRRKACPVCGKRSKYGMNYDKWVNRLTKKTKSADMCIECYNKSLGRTFKKSDFPPTIRNVSSPLIPIWNQEALGFRHKLILTGSGTEQ